MTEFLKLSKKNKELFFRMAGAKNEGIAPAILEKDLWMCQVMRSLFGNPESLPMVFKGGTSLSKIYKAWMVSFSQVWKLHLF